MVVSFDSGTVSAVVAAVGLLTGGAGYWRSRAALNIATNHLQAVQLLRTEVEELSAARLRSDEKATEANNRAMTAEEHHKKCEEEMAKVKADIGVLTMLVKRDVVLPAMQAELSKIADDIIGRMQSAAGGSNAN